MIEINKNFNFHQKQNLIVIWQAKASCTIVNKMYFEQEGLLDKALKYSNWIHDYRKIYTKNNKILRKEGILSKNTKYIQFVVNPYRRVVSGYIHCMKYKYLKIDNYNISFEQFIDILMNNNINDDHHNLQLFYLYKNKNIEYIKMEYIDKYLDYINKKYELNYKIHMSDHNSEKYDIPDEFIGKKMWNEIEKIPKNYYNFYNKNIKKKVEILYKLDLKIFKYTWEEFLNNKI
jgi:hypothetical protein